LRDGVPDDVGARFIAPVSSGAIPPKISAAPPRCMAENGAPTLGSLPRNDVGITASGGRHPSVLCFLQFQFGNLRADMTGGSRERVLAFGGEFEFDNLLNAPSPKTHRNATVRVSNAVLTA